MILIFFTPCNLGDLICAIDNGCELESGKYGLKDNCCVNLEDFICDGGGECCSDLFDRGLRVT